MIDSIKKLFAEYEKAFNVLDVEKQVPFFAEHFISAGPGAVSRREGMSSLKWRLEPRNFTGGSVRHPQKFFPRKKSQSAMNIPWSESTGE